MNREIRGGMSILTDVEFTEQKGMEYYKNGDVVEREENI